MPDPRIARLVASITNTKPQLENLEARNLLADATGLIGQYFANTDLSGNPRGRTDQNVNFDWNREAPIEGLKRTDFSVRWTGLVTPQVSGAHTFITRSDDGVRVWVNGQLLINNWSDHAETTDQGKISLRAGESYTLEMDYYQKSGLATAMLLWSVLGAPAQVIPTETFTPRPAAAAVAPSELKASSDSTTTIDLTWTDPSDGSNGFIVERSENGVDYKQIATLGVGATKHTDKNVALGMLYFYRVTATGSKTQSAAIATGPVTPQPPSGVAGDGHGLLGTYYNGKAFEDLVLTRVDPQLDFDWGQNAPADKLGKTKYSVLWTGQIRAAESGKYTIYTSSDDGVRMWIGDKRIINNYSDHAVTTDSAEVSLEAGQRYDVAIQYYNDALSGTLKLFWTPPGGTKAVIPTQYLFPSSKSTGSGVSSAPIAPTGLTATDSSRGSVSGVTLSWTDVPAESGYNIQRSTDGMTFNTVATTDADETKYVDERTIAGTSYVYRIIAYNSIGSSPSSNVAAVTTKAIGKPPVEHLALNKPTFSSSNETPQLSAANATDGSASTRWSSTFTDPQWIYVDLGAAFNVMEVKLDWDQAYAKSFEINVSDDTQTWRTIYANTDSVGGKQVISGLSGQGRYVRVLGLKRKTEWGYSLNEFDVSGTPVPLAIADAPQAPTLKALSGEIILTWTGVARARTYNIYRGVKPGEISNKPIATDVTVNEYADRNLAPETIYYYAISAVNESGESAWSSEASARTLPPPPAGPVGVKATASSPSRVVISWKDVASASGYVISRSTDGTNYQEVGNSAQLITSFTDTGLTPSTKYFYTVAAKGAWGTSLSSAPATVSTLEAPPPPPSASILAPAKVRAVATSTSNVTISWAHVAGASGFEVMRSSDGQNYTRVAVVGPDINNCVDSTLAAGTNYSYRVITQSTSGNSQPSVVASATTEAQWSDSGQPAPETTGGWTTVTAPGIFTPKSTQPNNIFYAGMPINFELGNTAVTYHVRDYEGNLVDKGIAKPNTTLGVSKPGWYKLYVYGANATPQFGNIVGTANFVVFRNDPNFAKVTDLYQGGWYYISKGLTRVDAGIDFAWGYGSPGGSIGSANYAVEWTGQVQPKFTESYTFTTKSDDGVRLWVDGKLLINNWTPHAAAIDNASISLEAGRRYDIKVQYFQGGWDSTISLAWSSPSTPKEIVPANVLFPTVSTLTAGGLTGTYYNGLTSGDPSENQVVRDVTGMGPERLNIADTSDPQKAIESVQLTIAASHALAVGRDAVRPNDLLLAFTNGTSNLASVKQIVTALQDKVKYWEGQNEPNYHFKGRDYVAVQKAFYETVKSVNPKLKVIGPATVSIIPDGEGLYWLSDFLDAGGGKYIDALSFHFYNSNYGSLAQMRRSLDGLKALMAKHGLQDMPLWQTEQGYPAAVYGAYTPKIQGQWQMLQMMTFEQYGIPKEQNVLWYDVSHGFWDVPHWWQNDDGTLNPAASLMRVWSEELFGKKFQSAYDFGSANHMFIGNLFSGSGKSVAAFMAAGHNDGLITLNVSGDTLKVISAFGEERVMPVIQGQVQLQLGAEPVYVEIASGQTLAVQRDDWGTNLARQPGTTASYSEKPNSPGIEKIINGTEENWYWDGISPWGDGNYTNPNGWVQVSLPSVQTVSRVVIRAASPWQLSGTLLDYELQYESNGRWITLNHVKQQSKTFGVLTPIARTTADSFFDNQYVFMSEFAPFQAQNIRLLVHAVTYGGGATPLIPQAGGQASPTPTLSLTEFEIYGK
ncbi:MAG: discoidin domain-containing protein [Burkholderiales bacterium]|nr:discoidin domain-containing protein [Phycisphaerae bacterium]